MDNKSRYSFMFGELVALYTEYRISAGCIGELKSLKAQDVLLIQIERNFIFKRRALKLARSPYYIVQCCKQDLNTFLCFYRAKQDHGCEVNEASNLHTANVLKARSFVLACQCTVSVRSPYSLKSRGGTRRVWQQKRTQLPVPYKDFATENKTQTPGKKHSVKGIFVLTLT